MCLPLAALAPIIGGALAAGGSVASSVIGSNAAKGSMEEQIRAAMEQQNKALDFQKQVYGQQREDQAPWLEARRSSLGELLRQMQAGQFETPYQKFDGSMLASDPGFQFRMAEGQKALERSASARGFLNSGGALKSLERYSQGLASDEYQNAFNRHQADFATRESQNMNRFNRLSGLAGTGQASAQNLGGLGAAFSGQVGQNANSLSSLMGALGSAGAAQAMGNANAVGNAFNTLGGGLMYGLANMPQQQIPTQAPQYGQSTMGYPTNGYGPWR